MGCFDAPILMTETGCRQERLLTGAAMVALFVPILSWLLTVARGQIPIWVPYISDLPLAPGAAYVFPIGLSIAALLFATVAPQLHRALVLDVVELGPHWQRVPQVASLVLWVATLSLLVVAHFTWADHPLLHYVAAAGFFYGFLTWSAITCAISHAAGRGVPIRTGLTVLGFALMSGLSLISLSGGDVPEVAEDLRWLERPWSMTVAASIEWVLIGVLAALMLTWRDELASSGTCSACENAQDQEEGKSDKSNDLDTDVDPSQDARGVGV